MTKIKKSYLGIGIVFAVVAFAVSMMFLSFSYASENVEEQLSDQQANEALTVTFNFSGEYDASCFFDADNPQGSGAE